MSLGGVSGQSLPIQRVKLLESSGTITGTQKYGYHPLVDALTDTDVFPYFALVINLTLNGTIAPAATTSNNIRFRWVGGGMTDATSNSTFNIADLYGGTQQGATVSCNVTSSQGLLQQSVYNLSSGTMGAVRPHWNAVANTYNGIDTPLVTGLQYTIVYGNLTCDLTWAYSLYGLKA